MKVEEVYNALESKEPFSVLLLLKNGEVRYYHRAVDCGQKWNLKERHMRALRPIDCKGNKISHEVPFSVFKILKFNGEKVIL